MPPYQNAVHDFICPDHYADGGLAPLRTVYPGQVLRTADLIEPFEFAMVVETPVVPVVTVTVETVEVKKTQTTITGPADEVLLRLEQLQASAQQSATVSGLVLLQRALEAEQQRRIDKLNQEFFQKMLNAEDWLTAPWHLAPDRYGTPLAPAPRVTCHHAGSY